MAVTQTQYKRCNKDTADKLASVRTDTLQQHYLPTSMSLRISYAREIAKSLLLVKGWSPRFHHLSYGASSHGENVQTE